MNLDRTDLAILDILQHNARISNKDLAEEVGVAASTCLDRVRRLRSIGAITNFRTEVAMTALGIGVEAMISLRLVQHANISFDQLTEELMKIPEAVEVYVLAGAHDILIHVAIKDVNHLRKLIGDKFSARGDIAHIETWIIFEHVRSPSLPNYREG